MPMKTGVKSPKRVMNSPNYLNFEVRRDGTVIGQRGNVLKTKLRNGYPSVSYRTPQGKVRHQYVHRMVAELYVDNPDGLGYVNHIDGDKLNPAADNLEWCTAADNTAHAVSTGLLYNLPSQGQWGFQCAS